MVTSSLACQSGRYLTADELADMVAPPQEYIEAVKAWLAHNGVSDIEISRNRDYVRAITDVARAQTLLECDFGLFQHKFVSTFSSSRVW